jgi:hypothetical protein
MGAPSSSWRATSLLIFVALNSILVLPGEVRADEVHFSAYDLRSLFFISKSSNANRVRYALRLDRSCQPLGDEPVQAYWQNLERGPHDLEPLSTLDQLAYGIAEQHVRREGTQAIVQLVLRAVKSRPVRVQIEKVADACRAEVTVLIGDKVATLEQVHVTLESPVSVRHLDILGRTQDGAQIEQRLSP